MSDSKASEAAAAILAAWRRVETIDGIPQACRPASEGEGYQAQDALVAAMGEPVAGYKLGATSPGAQEIFSVDKPFVGTLFESSLLQNGATVAKGGVTLYGVEAEFVFRFSADIPARAEAYSVDEVMAATGQMMPAIEVPDTRLSEGPKAGIAQVLADDGLARYLVLGSPVEGWRDADLPEHPVALRVNGETVSEGSGANVLGDPRVALQWLVNHRSGRGKSITAGEVVTTGSAAALIKVQPGDSVEADFADYGVVTVEFAK